MAGKLLLVLLLVALVAAGCGSGPRPGPAPSVVEEGLSRGWATCVGAGWCPEGAPRRVTCTPDAEGGDDSGLACRVELESGEPVVVRVVCDPEECAWESPFGPRDTGLPGESEPPFRASFPVG